MEMLTVWCVWWRDPADPDKYSAYYVKRLKRTVAENLDRPHRFVCITSERIDGVETMPPAVEWPGWWQKIQLWSPGICDAYNLYLDLDVVITGDLTELVKAHEGHALAMPLNWAQSGHGGCQSSVMLWRQCQANLPIWKDFNPDWIHWPPKQPWIYYGDQEWITRLRDTGRITVVPINAEWIKSYKYHCREGLPQDCRIAVFHGEPKPAQVKASWYKW
jgi:hypothetical protein